jgi:hypothetical protein
MQNTNIMSSSSDAQEVVLEVEDERKPKNRLTNDDLKNKYGMNLESGDISTVGPDEKVWLTCGVCGKKFPYKKRQGPGKALREHQNVHKSASGSPTNSVSYLNDTSTSPSNRKRTRDEDDVEDPRELKRSKFDHMESRLHDLEQLVLTLQSELNKLKEKPVCI